MNDFEFISPTYFLFGKGKESEAGRLCAAYGAHKVLLHYGGGSAERSGLLDRVREALEQAGIAYVELGGVQPNPRAEKVYEGIELCRREGVDFILGVGGGSSIDSAKAIAFGSLSKHDFWDHFLKRIPIERALPVATILTLPATGSEASDGTVVQKDGKKYGFGSPLLRPVFSILDPELCYSLPPYQTACGIADMLAHILERYLSRTEGVGFTDRLCEAAMKSIIEYGALALREPRNYEARANLMWAGTVAHNNSLGVGREQDWSSHAMEHELSAAFDVAHGAGLAVVFPAFMLYTLEQDPERYAQLAVRVWNVEPNFRDPAACGCRGIEAFRAFFKSLGLPVSLEELGVPVSAIPELAARTRLNNGDKLGYFQPLDREDIRAVFELCCQNPGGQDDDNA